jgi:hypothetical protein
MTETPQQYTTRIMSHVAGQEPLEVLAATPRKIARMIAVKTPAKLRKRPAPDKWSVGEIVAHLADAEIVISWRVRAIVGAPGIAIQAYDQEAWAAAGQYARRNPRQSLAQLRSLREANLAFYKSLSPAQWKLYGMHSERGEESVEQIARMIAGHDLNHLQQIERILRPKKKEG